MPLSGGHSKPKPPNEEERKFLTSPKVQTLVQEAYYCSVVEGNQRVKTSLSSLSSSLSFLPELMTRQVVAGTVYRIKYKIHWMGNDDPNSSSSSSSSSSNPRNKYVYVKLFEPLPYENKPPELMKFSFTDEENVFVK